MSTRMIIAAAVVVVVSQGVLFICCSPLDTLDASGIYLCSHGHPPMEYPPTRDAVAATRAAKEDHKQAVARACVQRAIRNGAQSVAIFPDKPVKSAKEFGILCAKYRNIELDRAKVIGGPAPGKVTFAVEVMGDDEWGQLCYLANAVVAYCEAADEARLIGFAPPMIPNDLLGFLLEN
ncbi:hypothetical protein A2215_01760 [Candidatus Berkelbacteria bacterium RIFOXYA2_FULL_43_10]|uniref:Uncharacterized protein n=1 Tax=Candidatus Berkelbacteria bacterium RIFOXYA2_FULL_43_10 TaxID=1797472 RepID=A0A1F5E785_9BACT|nr:MAG: hypothetical protein A2215_01760 [Candidatus Berkelbacteria bacterium RIFOXYA2_FULL_43_10]